MWSITEISIETRLSPVAVMKLCEENKIKVRACFGSDDKYLGQFISDCDYDRYFSWTVVDKSK
jgi:hypothetical protein